MRKIGFSRRRFGQWAAGGVALTALSACGGAREAPAGVLRRGTANEPQSLDPHYVPGNAGAALMYDMFEGLMSYDAEGRLTSGLAESYEVSNDGLRYTFTLYDNLKWSDGTPLTSEDFIYSFRRSADPASATRSGRVLGAVQNFRQITRGEAPVETLGITAPDARTVVVDLEYPASYLPDVLASFSSAVVPRHAIEAHAERWTRPENIVVSGAYTLAEWVPNTSIRLKKNPHFHHADQVEIDEVIFYPVERPATAVTRFRAGELDIVFNIPPDQIDALREAGFGEAIRSSPTVGVFYALLNNREAPTNDPRVREALSLSVDRELICNTLLRGEGDPAYSIVPAAMPDYEHAQIPMESQPIEARRERARALLSEAGYSAANPLAVTYKFGGQEINRRVAVALQSMWREIGVNAQLENVGGNSIVADARNGNYEAMRYQYYAPYQDPVAFLLLLQSEANTNFSFFNNAEFDRLLDRADRTPDEALRKQRLREVEEFAMSQFPVIPIYFNRRNYLVNTRVKGWRENVRGEHLSRYLSIES
ncbi:MAG: peptide ABC transporter substrate-binding protein [Terricaulis sp.]|nr:peptide ABC transporter substrate-binding protein [Terricaulis sp.]